MAEDIAAKSVQVLDLMLSFFADERYWLRRNFRGSDGRHCLVDAVTHFSIKLGLPKTPLMSLLQEALPQRQMGLVAFNDRCRGIDELRAVIRKARGFALENAVHERAAAAVKSRLLAEVARTRRAAGCGGQPALCSVFPQV
jgi:hypothetical protein